jgi:hypothetical protein
VQCTLVAQFDFSYSPQLTSSAIGFELPKHSGLPTGSSAYAGTYQRSNTLAPDTHVRLGKSAREAPSDEKLIQASSFAPPNGIKIGTESENVND